MGIKDLRPFLKKKSGSCFRKLPLKLLKGKKIGIDSLNWIFTYLFSASQKCVGEQEDIFQEVDQEILYKHLISEFRKFNIKLLNYGIIPIWIWDGVSKSNKTATKVERKKSREKIYEKRDNLKEELLNLNVLERPHNLVEEYKKLVQTTTYIKRKTIEKIKDYSKSVGLPTIFSEDEAENLASSLAIEKRIIGVWSADTDTLALGCPLLVKGFEFVDGDLCFQSTFTSEILKGLNLTMEEFRDFCIMLGTDFNERMFKIGPQKSYLLIQKYKNIEKIEKETKHNTYCLKVNEVRPQLEPYPTDHIPNSELGFGESNITLYLNDPETIDLINKIKNLSK